MVEAIDLGARVETVTADLHKRRAAAKGDAATRLQPLEARLVGAGEGGSSGSGGAASSVSRSEGGSGCDRER